MARMGMDVDVRRSGPFFTIRESRMDIILRAAEDAVAEVAFEEVHRIMDASFKNPTGFYESQVVIDRQIDDVVITDQGVVYGPWLEGVGSMNKVTRFKGYAMFRRAAKLAQATAAQVAEPDVSKTAQRELN